MKRIILLSCLSLIFFASVCRAMDERELSRHLKKLFISPPTNLQLELESESSQEEFTPPTSWQDDSLMEPQSEKENIPPHQHKKREKHMDAVAKLVDDVLGTNQGEPKKGHPGLQRSNAFHIPR